MALASKLFTPHYAQAVSRKVSVSGAALHATPDGEGLANLAADEEFALLDITAGWAWGYRASDHMVGYVRAEALTD